MTDKAIYQQAFEEMTSGNLDPALWAMVWTEASGEDKQAKSLYVKRRVAELKAQSTSSARQELRAEWRQELSCLHRSEMCWGFVVLLILANALYIFWCFHNPMGTGKLVTVGALIGFNLLPAAVLSIGLLAFRQQPVRAITVAASSTTDTRRVHMISMVTGSTGSITATPRGCCRPP